jgi:7,8-dihydroneopterin aldolase/epimerase/oxygenase
MHERNPLGRGVTTGDVVAALDFLIAAGTVTGEVLTIDGGLQIRRAGPRRAIPVAMIDQPKLSGLVPDALAGREAPRYFSIQLEVVADIGFHEFEIGSPQRLLVTVEVWLTRPMRPPATIPAWPGIMIMSGPRWWSWRARRYNLQETFAEAIYLRLAAMRGVKALRITTSKPDIYADARAVGVEFASFEGPGVQR